MPAIMNLCVRFIGAALVYSSTVHYVYIPVLWCWGACNRRNVCLVVVQLQQGPGVNIVAQILYV